MKAEVHTLLQDIGVSKVSMRPVRRNYAFEERAVAPGDQWVLKVKYPGTAQTLPAGLSGAHNTLDFVSWPQRCAQSQPLAVRLIAEPES